MFCEKCGKEIENDAVFCPYCGETVSAADVPAMSNDEKTEVFGSQTNMTQMEKQIGATKQKNIVAILIAACVVLLGGIITGVVFLVKGNSKSTADGEGEQIVVQGEEETSENVQNDGYDITVYDAALREKASNVQIKVFDETGSEVASGVTDENGYFKADLPTDGSYKISCEKDGYYTDSVMKNFEKGGDGEVVPIVPVTEGNGAYILLEWDSQDDLDLCLFNTASEEIVRANYTQDVYGNCSYGDGDGQCPFELVYMPDMTRDAVNSVYVLDYSTVQGGGNNLSSANGSVRVYTAAGLKIQKIIDATVQSSLWIPCYFYAGQVYEDGQIIAALPDWALSDKDADISWAQIYYDEISCHYDLYSEYATDAFDWVSDTSLLMNQFLLMDIDADEIPELIVLQPCPDASASMDVYNMYAIKDGELYKSTIGDGYVESTGYIGEYGDGYSPIESGIYSDGSIVLIVDGGIGGGYELIKFDGNNYEKAAEFHEAQVVEGEFFYNYYDYRNKKNNLEYNVNASGGNPPERQECIDAFLANVEGEKLPMAEFMNRDEILAYLAGLLPQGTVNNENAQSTENNESTDRTEEVMSALNGDFGQVLAWYLECATAEHFVSYVNGESDKRNYVVCDAEYKLPMLDVIPNPDNCWEFYISESGLNRLLYFESRPSVQSGYDVTYNGVNYYYFGDYGESTPDIEYSLALDEVSIMEIDEQRVTLRLHQKWYDFWYDHRETDSYYIALTLIFDPNSTIGGLRMESARIL